MIIIEENTIWFLVILLIGWVGLFLALTLMIVLAGKWKTVFKEKEWTLIPTLEGKAMLRAIKLNSDWLERLQEATLDAVDATRATREEFGILGTELDKKSQELQTMRMGQEFHNRKAMILAAIRALEMIGIDKAADGDTHKTLHGIFTDLTEALDDNHVATYMPSVGERVPTRGVDVGSARYTPTAEHTLVGTIASVERPAYIATGPSGDEEVLKAAVVTIYVQQEDSQ